MYRDKITGLYIIKCYANNKCYVGQSLNVLKRWLNHKFLLRKGIHTNTHLQSAWNKYGESSFLFALIDKCSIDDINDREDYWIRHFNSINHRRGFNKLMSGKVPVGKGLNKCKRGRGLANRKNTICINLTTGDVVTFLSISQASTTLAVKYKRIQECISYWNPESKASKKKKSSNGWIFINEELYNPEFDYLSIVRTRQPNKNPRSIKPKIKRIYKSKAKNPEDIKPYSERNVGRKAVKLVHRDTGEVLIFSSQLEAVKKLNLVHSKVYYCIKTGKNTHHGYYFYTIGDERAA